MSRTPLLRSPLCSPLRSPLERVWIPRALAAGALLLALGSPACGGGDDSGAPCDSTHAVTIQVTHAGAQADVDLSTLPGTPDGDLCLISLDRVVEAAGLGIDLAQVVVDLRGTDGFQPTQVECAPLEGTLLAQGQIDRRTGSVAWDPALNLRGCYSVTSLAALLVLDATPTP